MALHVLTFKLQDGTTQTVSVPAGVAVADFVAHIKTQGGFWNDRPAAGQGAGGSGSAGIAGGATVGAVYVNWETVASVTYTS